MLIDFYQVSEYLNFVTILCNIVFRENRNSLRIQNGGPKFTKFPYFDKFLNFAPI